MLAQQRTRVVKLCYYTLVYQKISLLSYVEVTVCFIVLMNYSLMQQSTEKKPQGVIQCSRQLWPSTL